MINPLFKREDMSKQQIQCKLPLLAIIVPCFNEGQILQKMTECLSTMLSNLISKKKIAKASFVYFIDDGSSDNTWEVIEDLHKKNNLFKGIKLSRNFGQQNALYCGFVNCSQKADCTISIDADLEDDVIAIENFVDRYHEGYDIVYGVRKDRKFDTFFKKNSARFFYRCMRLLGVEIVQNHGDYRLVSKKVITHLANFSEFNLFLRGLFPLLGFKSAQVYYDRGLRTNGKSKYSLKRLLLLACDGITAFSIAPLRLISVLGFSFFTISIMVSVYFIFRSWITNEIILPWVWTVLPIYFIGGVQLLCIGILGEYIGRIHQQTKARPRFIIEEEIC